MHKVLLAAVATFFLTCELSGAALADLPVAATASPQAAVPADAQAIFTAARSAWAFTSYPRYANYTVGVHYRNAGVNVQRHYSTLQDLRRNIVFAQTFSREETADPSTPHGTNIGALGMTLNTAESDDPIGPLALAVNYDFGISLAARPTIVAQMGSQVTAPDRLVVIGRTGASARLYNVRLIEMLDDGKTYHLGLTPLKDPGKNRLREMWVSAQTYITQKILIAQNFASKPYTDVPWLVTFKQIDGGPYISEERAQGALDFGDGGSLEDVTITFDEIKSASTLPPYGTVGIDGVDDNPAKFVTEP
jgi:hypothetical protein